MLGTIVQTLTTALYRHTEVPQDVCAAGPFGRLKVALVADYFTTVCLAAECRIRSLTPSNYRDVIAHWRPDLVFVESAFHGVGGEWRYKIAKQPKYMRLSQPISIVRLARFARDRGISTVFWNKDDGAFFDAFIGVARHFEHVFTTDDTCLPRYARALPAGSTAAVLAMPYQPALHSFTGFDFQEQAACFVGSYYRNILNSRRRFLDMIFAACTAAALPLHVFDRNSQRFSRFFEFRFPPSAALRLHRGVPYAQTAALYKHYAISLNVNSVTNSATMCSRRLLEILACGGILVTNSSPAVERCFRPFCHVVDSPDGACEVLGRLRLGPDTEARDRAEAGAAYVRREHTWERRLQQLADAKLF